MLTVSHLCKAFGGQAVLEDVSLTLSPRQTVCLMAPSGRGKTTLLRCMAGLEKPDSGVIMGVPERIGYVFQEDRLCDGFSAADNVRLVTGGTLSDAEIGRHLTELGLGGSLRQPVRELSGGGLYSPPPRRGRHPVRHPRSGGRRRLGGGHYHALIFPLFMHRRERASAQAPLPAVFLR